MPRLAHFRAFARCEVNLPVTLTSEPSGDQEAHLLNLGLGGACVEVTEGLGKGSRVTLVLSTPKLWDPLVIRTTVAWVRNGDDGVARAGLQFDHERSQAIRALAEVLCAERFE